MQVRVVYTCPPVGGAETTAHLKYHKECGRVSIFEAEVRRRIDRAKDILKTEGIASLVRNGFKFLVSNFFVYDTLYLYATSLEHFRTLDETDFRPKIDNFTLKIVSTNQEADRLEAEGIEFHSSTHNSRQRLDKGAIAFCIFVGRELANIGWIAMTEQATSTHMKVDFSNNEAHAEWAWTNPKYRRMGFEQYASFKRRQFVFSKGKTVFRSDIDKSNVAPQGSVGKFDSKYGEGRYLKILWWKSWKETYLKPDELTPPPSPMS